MMIDLQSIISFLLKPSNLWIIAFCVFGFQMTNQYIRNKKYIYNYFTYTNNGMKYCGLKNHYTAIHFKEYKNEAFFSEMKTIKVEISPEGEMTCLLNDIHDKRHVLSINKIEEFSKQHSKE